MKKTLLFTLLLFCSPVFLFSQNVGIGTNAPSERLDVDGKIRLRTGAQDGYILQSDATGVGTWIPPDSAYVGERLCVTEFGAIPDDGNDDLAAFQAAADEAAIKGSYVCVPSGLYILSATLNVPAGVSFVGEGSGPDNLATPSKGSTLRYTGTAYAISLQGENSGLQNMTIHDDANSGASGAIFIQANASVINRLIFSNLLIYGFTNGDGIRLEVLGGGKIQNSTFNDLRIQYALVGVRLSAVDPGSIDGINSNLFYNLHLAGNAFDTGLLINGGTSNRFESCLLDLVQTNDAHIKVSAGNIQTRNTRILAGGQNAASPVIDLAAGTAKSHIEGSMSNGLIINRGDNTIEIAAYNALGESNAGFNQFINASLKGETSTSIPTYWDISGAGVSVEIQAPSLIPNQHVLKVTVPAGILGVMNPEGLYMPTISGHNRYQYCNVGTYIKTDKPGIANVIYNSINGVTSSVPHRGDNEWQLVGQQALVDPGASINPRIFLNNTGEGSPTDFYITSPSLNFGQTLPSRESNTITGAGGVISGTLTTTMINASVPGGGFLDLPHHGNTFVFSGTGSIFRINYSANRFPKGTMITLLFDDAGMNVSDSVFIDLRGGFSSTANSSLTLISTGVGLWREVNRNN